MSGLQVGRNVEQAHLDNIQTVFERFFGTQRTDCGPALNGKTAERGGLMHRNS
jgi:hypothetical protein